MEGLHALAVCQVHVAPEGAQGLRQAELAVPGTHVHWALPLAVHEVKIGTGVEEEQCHVAMAAPQREVERGGALLVLGIYTGLALL